MIDILFNNKPLQGMAPLVLHLNLKLYVLNLSLNISCKLSGQLYIFQALFQALSQALYIKTSFNFSLKHSLSNILFFFQEKFTGGWLLGTYQI